MVFFSQVFLVQVNPGETFTIRAEDGTLQCIQGKRVLGRAGERLTVTGNLCSKLNALSSENVVCNSEYTVKCL